MMYFAGPIITGTDLVIMLLMYTLIISTPVLIVVLGILLFKHKMYKLNNRSNFITVAVIVVLLIPGLAVLGVNILAESTEKNTNQSKLESTVNQYPDIYLPPEIPLEKVNITYMPSERNFAGAPNVSTINYKISESQKDSISIDIFPYDDRAQQALLPNKSNDESCNIIAVRSYVKDKLMPCKKSEVGDKRLLYTSDNEATALNYKHFAIIIDDYIFISNTNSPEVENQLNYFAESATKVERKLIIKELKNRNYKLD